LALRPSSWSQVRFERTILGRSIPLAKKEMPKYAGTVGVFRAFRAKNDGKQAGDPDKGVKVILKAVDAEKRCTCRSALALSPARRLQSSARTSTPGKKWRRRPTTCESADRLESLAGRRRIGVRSMPFPTYPAPW